MPLSSNLSVAPYFDTYDPKKDYYRVLFQPSVSVQTRELNELQDIFQAQVERFGDNIFEAGTIIKGCSFSFDPNYNYIKINDLTSDNNQAVPSNYVGFYLTSQNNVKGLVKNYANGYQSQDPNLKTLYFDYISPGANGQLSFSSGDVLSLSSLTNQLFSVDISNPGQGYSNTDSLVFVSAVAVNNLVGTFSNGETVTQVTSGARAQIVAINTTAYSDRTILNLAPLTSDLSNTSLTTTPWNFSNNYSVTGGTSNAAAYVIDVIGSGAQGQVVTDAAGRIIDTVMVSYGADYRIAPYATIKPATNPSAASSGLSLSARNYLTKVTVASVANASGNGYAMSISDGIIYQKGYFLQTNAQTVIVSKYNSVPDQVSVVFSTSETIITPVNDPTLYDNALGQPNYTAPGANRIQLSPSLTVLNSNAVTSDQLILTSFSEGNPYLQNQYTKYTEIENEISQRSYEEAGNFVIDPFNVTTRSPILSTNVAQVSLIVEPGTGYISGHRVSLGTNYATGINKGTTTKTSNTIVSLNYDNYIRVNELGGMFGFNVGGTVTFYDTAKTFLSNTSLSLTSNTLPVGNIVGTSSIRSIVYESGIPGTNSASYKLYLFNTSAAVGKSLSSAKSVYYTNGVQSGIADIILSYNSSSGTYSANIVGNNSTMVFSPSLGPIQLVSNVSYTYRTVNNSITLANTGSATISVVANPGEYFPYSGTLSSIQLSDLQVVPLSNNVILSTAIAGTSTVNTTSNVMIGVGTTYGTSVMVGDYVYLANSTNSITKQVTSVVNSTYLTLDSVPSWGFAANNVYLAYPQNVQIPMNSRSWLSANVNSNGNILTLSIGAIQSVTSATLSVCYNVTRTNVSSGTKTAVRNNAVRIYTGNNAGGSLGPWCIGCADAIRLTGVYESNSTATTGNPANNITTSFYIDNNENADMVNLGYLYLNPSSKLNLSNTYLLVFFDRASVSVPGFFTTDSYTTANLTLIETNDSISSNALTNVISTWEISEFNDDKENYYDMMKYIDFRPISNPTANLSSISLNPTYSNTFSTSSDWKFPLPGSSLSANVTYYLPRIDSVVLSGNGAVSIISGVPSVNPKATLTPNNSMLLDQLLIPPYPNLPANPSSVVVNNAITFMGSGHLNTTRYQNSIIKSVLPVQAQHNAQPKGYTMADIANLDRRIQALEYEVSLNMLETSVANMNIPSSIANSVSRFIYGFYADDFSTKNFVNQDSIEWAATVDTQNKRLYPRGDALNLPHSSVKMPEFIEVDILSQPYATTPIQPCTISTTEIVYQTAARQSMQPQIWLFGPLYTDEKFKFSMSATTSGNATLYFMGLDPFYTIYQGNTVVASGANAVSLTEEDINFMDAQPFFHNIPWGHTFGSTLQALHGEPLIHYDYGAVSGAGKIIFNHNPANGTEYTIDVTDFANNHWALGYWAYMIKYPIDSDVFVDCARLSDGTPLPVLVNPSEIIVQSNTAYGADYWAALLGHGSTTPAPANPGTIHAQIAPNGVIDPQNPTIQDTKISFTVTGLSKSSYYKFFIEENDYSAWVKPSGGNLGSALITDQLGNLSFDFYYSPTHQVFSDPNIANYYAGFSPAPQGYSRFLIADATFNKNYYYGYILIVTPEQLWGN